MDIVVRNTLVAVKAAGVKTTLLGLLIAALSACGGDGVDIGDGQGADPVVVDFPLFYVKRPLREDDDAENPGQLEQFDLRDMLAVQYGADLYMRDRAALSANETNLTGDLTNGFGDIRDVSVSYDGTKVLFSMRFPVDPNGDEEDQPVWNIWEYDLETDSLRRVMADDITANEGHDLAPEYILGDRIIFSSSRQNRSVAKLVDQFKPQFPALDEEQEEPALVLHVMDEFGGNIEQLSFNQSHDMYPTMLSNGRIMFARWDGMVGLNAINLYTMNPDGTDVQLLYGADSHATGTNGGEVQFVRAQETLNGDVLAILLPFSGTTGGGDLIRINVTDYLNNTQPNEPNQGVLAGPAQAAATVSAVNTQPGFSVGGRFADAWPFRDGTQRALVSWTDCRVQLIDLLADPPVDPATVPVRPCSTDNLADPLAVEARPAYGVWAYDFSTNTQKPVVLAEAGFAITDVAIAQPLPTRPALIPGIQASGTADPALTADDAGILNIRSVYDIDGTDAAVPDIATVADPAQTLADDRVARFVRVIRAVAIPPEDTLDLDNTAFGVSTNFGMREIVGYAPVEPDGSVRIKVPADVPLSLDVLNKDGQRITPRKQHWLQVRPGEERTCNGCHFNAPDTSHGRNDAFASAYPGAPFNGYQFPNTLSTFFGDEGDTMAMARTRIDPTALEMSADLVYEDVWTDPDPTAANRAADLPFSLTYAAITETPAPDTFNCEPWTVDCRVVINYETHIQPLWERSRPVLDPMTMLEVDNHRCIDCHAFRDSDNMIIDPAARGQLELTGNASGDEPDHTVAYRELLFNDSQEVLADANTVIDLLADQGNVDINGDPILEPVTIGPPLSAGGAAVRPAFFFRFSPAGQHPEWLSAEELRLISEWLDLGAQYYNNPFDVTP